jgi:hypothetical protein
LAAIKKDTFEVKRKKKKDGGQNPDAARDAYKKPVPPSKTCQSRLKVVNTEFQLRHLIIWSSIIIHVLVFGWYGGIVRGGRGGRASGNSVSRVAFSFFFADAPFGWDPFHFLWGSSPYVTV